METIVMTRERERKSQESQSSLGINMSVLPRKRKPSRSCEPNRITLRLHERNGSVFSLYSLLPIVSPSDSKCCIFDITHLRWRAIRAVLRYPWCTLWAARRTRRASHLGDSSGASVSKVWQRRGEFNSTNGERRVHPTNKSSRMLLDESDKSISKSAE